MVYWQRFNPAEFEYEFDEEELAGHDVTPEEAREVFDHDFDVRKNTRHRVGYRNLGRTDAGRRLRVIVYEKRKGLLRIITGWQDE